MTYRQALKVSSMRVKLVALPVAAERTACLQLEAAGVTTGFGPETTQDVAVLWPPDASEFYPDIVRVRVRADRACNSAGVDTNSPRPLQCT
jgi:hypothetical protein